MRVLLIDDSGLFLDGLQEVLELHGFTVVGRASNPDEGIQLLEALRPDLVLMDIMMPGGSGILATRAITQKHPGTQVVMMTVLDDDNSLFEALVAGASGYLVKSTPGEELIAQLQGATRGEVPLSAGLSARILTEFSRRSGKSPSPRGIADPSSVLTERQREILRLSAEGKSYREVADMLGLAEVTIKYHMGQITKALQLENRTQAIAWGGKHLN